MKQQVPSKDYDEDYAVQEDRLTHVAKGKVKCKHKQVIERIKDS